MAATCAGSSSYAPIPDGTSLALSGEVKGPSTDEGAGDYIVMTVRLCEPGIAKVDRVDYALGADGYLRRGTDTVAVDVTLRAR